jgi:hypothetical protein
MEPSLTKLRAIVVVLATTWIAACGSSDAQWTEVTSTARAQALDAPVACVGCWLPTVGERWQYQLQGVAAYAATGGIDVGVSAAPATGGSPVAPTVFDIDLYVDAAIAGNDSTVATSAVAAVHARGGHVICYVSAGTYENWRPDASAYPAAVLGRKNGWPGERWVDVRRVDVLGPILTARAQRCKDAGFDGIEWDNVDGYQNHTGFPLTADQQLAFDTYLANAAHRLGLSVALKNDMEQVGALKPYFDYVVNEQCFQYRECDYPAPGLPDWTASGKAVFNVEYRSLSCSQADAWGISSIAKTIDLYDTPWQPCR